MSFHVDETTARRYRDDAVDRVTAASVEAHLTACDRCRRLLPVDEEWVERSWTGIAERVLPGRPGFVERMLTAVGVPGQIARLVAVSPALRLSFLLAVVLALSFAAVASTTDPARDPYRIFLLVAPVIPVAGVAVAYGRSVDPVSEFAAATPIGSLRLLLLRTIPVLVVSIGLTFAAWPFVSAPGWLGVSGWLLPALALTLITLALATRFDMVVAASVVSLAWVTALTLARVQGDQVFHTGAQGVYLVLIMAAATVVVVRRDRYDRQGEPG